MDLVTETQRRLYHINEEAKTALALVRVLEEFGIQGADRVELYYDSIQGNLIVRVVQSDGEDKSVVCPASVSEIARQLIKENGLKLSSQKTGIYVYTRSSVAPD